MLALAHHYDQPVTAGGIVYRARVYSGAEPDGKWGAWIVFFPVAGGRAIATDRETTQTDPGDLNYWASGLSPTYLEGALERALSLQPEAVMARELERLERLEAEAAVRADTLDLAAAAARAESKVAEVERERTEDRLLETVADTAETEARVHEVAAELSRKEAETAGRALKAKKKKKTT